MNKFKTKTQFLLNRNWIDAQANNNKGINKCFNEIDTYDKKEENSEDNMPLEISDEELIDMDPELLLTLQKYLKDRRSRHPAPLSETGVPPTEYLPASFNNNLKRESGQITVIKSWHFEAANALFEEVEGSDGLFLGSRISQDGRTYIGRHWKITDQLRKVMSISASLGFPKLWRPNHPQDSYLLGNENYLMGSHHISCSKTHDSPWIFALGSECLSNVGGRQFIKEISFNKIYGELIDKCLSQKTGEKMYQHLGKIEPGSYKIQRGGGHNFTIHPDDFEIVITYIAKSIS